MLGMEKSAAVDDINRTVDLVVAYLSNNHVSSAEIPALIANVHAALIGLSATAMQTEAVQKPTPADIKKSITQDHLISFEDGKPYKTLRRHLTLRGLSPEAYREKWGLPRDYPMTSAGYSQQRADLARALGRGQQRRRSWQAGTDAGAEADFETAVKPRGRRKTKEVAEAS